MRVKEDEQRVKGCVCVCVCERNERTYSMMREEIRPVQEQQDQDSSGKEREKCGSLRA